MINFKLLDKTTSKEVFVQINPVHVVSTETVVDTDLNSQCYIAHSSYQLVTGKQLQVCVVLPDEIPKEDFIKYLTNGLHFDVTSIEWSKS